MNDLTVSEDEGVTATTRELALKTATTVNTILFEIIIKKKIPKENVEKKQAGQDRHDSSLWMRLCKTSEAPIQEKCVYVAARRQKEACRSTK